MGTAGVCEGSPDGSGFSEMEGASRGVTWARALRKREASLLWVRGAGAAGVDSFEVSVAEQQVVLQEPQQHFLQALAVG
jgi:hypothetical protein